MVKLTYASGLAQASMVLAPLAIAYLVYEPDTRRIRIALWLLALASWIVALKTADWGYLGNLRVPSDGTPLVLGFATFWAFSNSAPSNHPLPRTPPYPRLRQSRLFKAIDLIWNSRRHVNIAPFYPRPLPASTRRYPWLSAMTYHLTWLIIALFLADLGNYLPWRFAPTTFGSPLHVKGDYQAWCRSLAGVWGVPVLLVRAVMMGGVAMTTHFGMTFLFHFFAIIGIGSGLYLPEEWPDITNWPILSTSLNDFWSKRWHQQMRFVYTFLAKPFEHFPRVIHLLAVFAISTLHHALVFWAPTGEWHFYPHTCLFVGSGIGCILERAFYRVTGRKVGGILGWIWTMGMMCLCAGPMVDWSYSSGWTGVTREAVMPEQSMVVWTVWALGLGPHPSSYALKE